MDIESAKENFNKLVFEKIEQETDSTYVYQGVEFRFTMKGAKCVCYHKDDMSRLVEGDKPADMIRECLQK